MLLAISPATASSIDNPRFFDYRGGTFINQLADFSFGWFRTLSTEQKETYHQSLTHALMFAENGQSVSWYKNDASGYSIPVMTWPTGSGFCRRMHIQVIAYNREKTQSATACFDNSSQAWAWSR